MMLGSFSHEVPETDGGAESSGTAGGSGGCDARGGGAAERLLERCLLALESLGAAGVEALLRAAPADASFVRSCLAHLGSLGLAPAGPGPTPVPERLADHDLCCRLGSGAMGAVFLAREPGTRRLVALKTLRADLRGTDDGVARFAREVAAVARLSHPGIVPLFRSGEADGIPFFTMEWVLGVSLAQVVRALSGRAPGQLTADDLHAAVRGAIGAGDARPVSAGARVPRASYVDACLDLVLQSALALAHAHERGVLHRDVKASNLLLDLSGRVRLVDFGLAQAEGTSRLTLTGTQVGSLPYLAPELLSGRAPHDVRSEVYALGVVLFELLALRLPYSGEHAEAVRQAILSGQPVPLRVLHPRVNEEVETVCLMAMAPERERRYADMAAFASDLRALLERRSVVARRPGPWLRARRQILRRPALATGLILGGLLVVGVPLLWAGLQARQARRVVELTDPFRARSLLEEERRLWPAVVDRVPEMEAWVGEAATLLARRPMHASRLPGLRARAVDHSPAAAPASRLRGIELEEQLAELRRSQVYGNTSMGATYPEYRKVLDPMIDDLTFEQRALLPFALPGPEEQREFEHLVWLLRDLDRLALVLPLVRDRITQARALAPRSVVACADAWQQASAAIARTPRYGGLQLAPIVGLVPLGPDPRSGLWEFAHLPSGEPASRDPATGRLRLGEANGLVLVLLPGGSFHMGARRPATPGQVGPNEDPLCEVADGPVVERVIRPFFLSKFELTQAQWLRLAGTNPSRGGIGAVWPGNPAPISALHPAERFTWFEGYEVARRLGLTLPTEVQWDYAMRGGTTTPWHWGATMDGSVAHANLRHAGDAVRGPGGDGWETHAPVGSFAPNPFGLHDMAGNVAEWCLDAWDHLGQIQPAPGDGRWTGRIDSPRAVRGGNAGDPPQCGRCAFRTAHDPNTCGQVGIRPALMF